MKRLVLAFALGATAILLWWRRADPLIFDEPGGGWQW